MSAVYFFRIEKIIGNSIFAKLKTTSRERGFLNEKYLAIQILRNRLVALYGEAIFPREKLYADKEWTMRLADEKIASCKLFNYNYPECSIKISILDDFLLHADHSYFPLLPANVFEIEAIYFDSNSFYEKDKQQLREQVLTTAFYYTIDASSFPDLCIELEFETSIHEQDIHTLEVFSEKLGNQLDVYVSKPQLYHKTICILLDFEAKENTKGVLENIVLDINSLKLMSKPVRVSID